MRLQYDGTGLHGWAKQPGLLTVEGCLEKALETAVGTVPYLGVAGRTDAGVHARRQVVSMVLPEDVDTGKLVASLNALTPEGIVIDQIKRMPGAFDARRDASNRTYRYFLSTARVLSPFWSRYCWDLGYAIDEGLLEQAAGPTVGRHDFTGFTPSETGHDFFHRTVERCAWRKVSGERGMWRLDIQADAFLRHMVRTLVGTMVEVAEGKRDMSSYERLLCGAGREAAGITAPAHGLFLWDIDYGGKRDGATSEGAWDGSDEEAME